MQRPLFRKPNLGHCYRVPTQSEPSAFSILSQFCCEQAAVCLDISLSSTDRAWRYARTWLYAAMAGADREENSNPA